MPRRLLIGALSVSLLLAGPLAFVANAVTPAIWGTVSTNDGSGVSGVLVQAWADGALAAQTVTGVTGAYSLMLSEGAYSLSYAPPTAAYASLRTLAVQVPRDQGLDVVLTAPTVGRVSLTGQVMLSTGETLGTVEGTENRSGVIFGTGGNPADEDGYFDLIKTAGESGQWLLSGRRILDGGFIFGWTIYGGGTYAMNQDTYQEFILPMTTTRVSVVNALGNPIPGANCTLSTGRWPDYPDTYAEVLPGEPEFVANWSISGTAGDDGVIELPSLGMSRDSLAWLGCGAPPDSGWAGRSAGVQLTAGGTDLTFALTNHTVWLRGHANYSDGQVVYPGDVLFASGGNRVDADGGFALLHTSPVSGTWAISGSRKFSATQTLGFNLFGGSTRTYSADVVRDFTVPLMDVQVRVIDNTGAPVPNAAVWLQVDDTSGVRVSAADDLDPFGANWSSFQTTDSSGYATLRSLRPTAPVFARFQAGPPADSGWTWAAKTALVGDGSVVEIVLTVRTLWVSGKVTYSDGQIVPTPSVLFGDGGNSTDETGHYALLKPYGATGQWQLGCRRQDPAYPDPLCFTIIGGNTRTLYADTVQDFVLPLEYTSIKVVDPSGAGIPGVSLRLSVGSYGYPDGSAVILPGEPAFLANWTGVSVTQEDGTSFVPGLKMTSATLARLALNPPADSRYLSRAVDVTVSTNNELVVVLAIKPPILASFTPTSGQPGSTVVLTGEEFLGATRVSIGGVQAPYVVNSSKQITVTVPSDAASGTISVVNGGGTSTSAGSFSVLPSPMSITTSALTSGTVKVAYSVSLGASGGTGPYFWSRTAGGLPKGLSLSSAGAISGTPTMAGSWTFTVSVVDSRGQTLSKVFSILIASPLTVTTSTLPGGTRGSAYQASLAASGGLGTYTWVLASGILPSGLTLYSGGQIGGTPISVGSSSFTVEVADSEGRTSTKVLTVTVTDTSVVTITTTALPDARSGKIYSATLSATGGSTAYIWTLESGTLPTGITLSSSGVLSGSAFMRLTYTFTVRVTDSLGRTSTKTLSIKVR